jgi:hypothetical protein
MRSSKPIKPISITKKGEARAVLVDVRSDDETRETLALLQILAMTEKEIESGQTVSLAEIVAEFRARKPKTAPKAVRKSPSPKEH